MGNASRKRVVVPALCMLVLSLLLCWLPLFGPLIAGFVGGRLAGGAGSAFLASILPALFLAALVFLAMSLASMPLLGLLLGLGSAMSIVLGEIGLVAGAIVGGLLSK